MAPKRVAVFVSGLEDYPSSVLPEICIHTPDGDSYWIPGTKKGLGVSQGGIYVLEDTGEVDEFNIKIWRKISEPD